MCCSVVFRAWYFLSIQGTLYDVCQPTFTKRSCMTWISPDRKRSVPLKMIDRYKAHYFQPTLNILCHLVEMRAEPLSSAAARRSVFGGCSCVNFSAARRRGVAWRGSAWISSSVGLLLLHNHTNYSSMCYWQNDYVTSFKFIRL